MSLPDGLITNRTAKLPGDYKKQPRAHAVTKRPDGMNKTEARFAAELDALKRDGVVADYRFESVKLRLAHKCFYTPDFLVLYADGRLRFVEIKGFMRDDAAVKYKLAREAYGWAEWSMLRLVKGVFVPVNI